MIEKSPTLRVDFEGELGPGVVAKDLLLHLIGREGADGGAGHALEFAGSAVEALSMEGRMTLCNLGVEFGAKFALVAPDEERFSYIEGGPFAPKGSHWDEAVTAWRRLSSDEGAHYDQIIRVDATQLAPQVTWGTSPAHVVDVTGCVPDPSDIADSATRESMVRALDYMGLRAGMPLEGLDVQIVFIGSCTNGRISDLRAAARIGRGRKVAPGVRALVVPGSRLVKQQAEDEGLDILFKDAGFEWREPGCSMCMSMNDDTVPSGARCISTSNRNFVGRQGPGARTHLASPAMAAASAITGQICDVRAMGVS